jgi:hypothetical protein
VPQDELDQRFAAKAMEQGLATPGDLATAATRAVKGRRGLTWGLIVQAPAPKAAELRTLLRSLHAEVPDPTAPDSLRRHRDRLLGRLAVRKNLVDAKTLKTALVELDARRAGGEKVRLGDVLIEHGALDEAAADKLSRKYDEKVVLCSECFGTNPRNPGSGESWAPDCVRCGGELRLASLGLQPSWVTKAVAAAQDEESEARREKAVAGTREPPKPKPRPARPKPAASDPAASRKAVAIAVAGMIGLGLLFALIGWRSSVARRRDEAWAAIPPRLAEARSAKEKGELQGAIDRLTPALVGVAELTPPDDKARVTAEQAREEVRSCEELLAAEKEGPARLAALAAAATDPAVLGFLCDKLAATTDPAAVEVLTRVAGAQDAVLARRVLALVVARPSATFTPVLVAAIGQKNDALARDATRAALALDKLAAPAFPVALARFPDDAPLTEQVAEQITAWRDPACVTPLRALARVRGARVSEAAIGSLAVIAAPESTAELVLGLDSHVALQGACGEALAKIGDVALDTVSRAVARQSSAVYGLVAIGSPGAARALEASLDRLDKLGSDILVEALATRPPSPSLRPIVTRMVELVRGGVRTRSYEQIHRYSGETLERVARAYGLNEAALELRYDLFFETLEERKGSPLLASSFKRTSESQDGSARLELKNHTRSPLVVYARGPELVDLRVPANGTASRRLKPGKYRVGTAFIWGGNYGETHLGDLELRGDETWSLDWLPAVAKLPTEKPAASDAERTARLKKIFEREARAAQLIEDARRRLPELVRQSPWGGAATVETTDHYRIETDADKQAARRVGAEAEACWKEYAKYLPPTGQAPPSVIRFFSRREPYEEWRRRTSLAVIVGQSFVSELRLVERAKAQARRIVVSHKDTAEMLEKTADALLTTAGLDAIGIEELFGFDDELANVEADADDGRAFVGILKAMLAVRFSTVLLASLGNVGGRMVVGYYNRETHELVLYDRGDWLDTLRHEAFHQFFMARVARPPLWLNEGLATYFEVWPESGKNQSRIDELRRTAAREPAFLERVRLADVLLAESFDSIDYALSWSFIFYLVEEEPLALAKVLARVREGLAPAQLLSALPNLAESESRWKARLRALVR